MNKKNAIVERDEEGFIVLRRKGFMVTNSMNNASASIGAYKMVRINQSRSVDPNELKEKPASYYDLDIAGDKSLDSMYWLQKAWTNARWSVTGDSSRFSNDQWVCKIDTDKPTHITNVFANYVIIVDGLPEVRVPDSKTEEFQHLRTSSIFSSYLRLCYCLWKMTLRKHKKIMDKIAICDRIRMIVTYDDMSVDVLDCSLKDALSVLTITPKSTTMDNKPYMWGGYMNQPKDKKNK